MDQTAKYTLKSLALVPVCVAIVAGSVQLPILLTKPSRDNTAGFFAALAVGIGLAYGTLALVAPGLSKLAGDPGPIEPLPARNPKLKWRPLGRNGKPIYYR
jgi:hypothetical protein